MGVLCFLRLLPELNQGFETSVTSLLVNKAQRAIICFHKLIIRRFGSIIVWLCLFISFISQARSAHVVKLRIQTRYATSSYI